MVAPKMETRKIAIVILNWNGRNWLEKFLPTVVRHAKDAKVIVADNNSSDDSVHYLKQNFPIVQIIQNDGNYGFAKGYNLALKQINAEYYILLNSDIEVTENWISPIINLMDADNTIAACQPKLLDFKNKNKFEYAGASGGYIDCFGYPFCRGRIFNYLEEDNGQYDDVKEVFWATGACLFVRAKNFWEVGGFDEDFFAHQEEIDLCWRLKNKGHRIMVEPKSKVYHVGGATLNVGSPLKTHLNFRNNLFMLFKNLPLAHLLFVLPCRLVLDGIAALTFLNGKKGFQHLFAIAKAHFSFYFALPQLIVKRQKTNQKPFLIGKMSYSILVKNKLKGKKFYSEL